MADTHSSLEQRKSSRLPTRSDVVAKAREYLGVRYVHVGRSKEHGVDCIGLVSGVAVDLGLTQHDMRGYSQFPDGVTLLREFDQCLLPGSGEAGDVAVFWIRHRDYPSHAGIITSHGLIHTHAGVGKVVEHKLDLRWRARIVRFYSYPGLA